MASHQIVNHMPRKPAYVAVFSVVIAVVFVALLVFGIPRLMPVVQPFIGSPDPGHTGDPPLPTPATTHKGDGGIPGDPAGVSNPSHEYTIIFDTPPLYSLELFHQALTKICDWIEQNTTSGNGDTIYYLDYQTGQSHNRMAFPPIVAAHLQKDEPPPAPIPDYVPKPGDTAYDIAKQQSEIDAKNKEAQDAWVARETAIKQTRAEVQAFVHQQVAALRRVNPIYDSSASDYIGALEDAESHSKRFPAASHTIVIASALVQNTKINQTGTPLSLRGARVVGIYISAPTMPELQECEQAFRDIVTKAGASSVDLYEPQDSVVLPLSR